jgi:hypothetical protein
VPLAVVAVVAQAAVQDADQTVGQCSEGLVVGGAAAAQLVVVGPSAWGTGQGAEGPEVAGVGQAFVAGQAGEDDGSGARGTGDRGGAGIGLAGGRVGVAGRVIPELRQHPGAEDHAESGQTTQDLGVRVDLKALARSVCSALI